MSCETNRNQHWWIYSTCILVFFQLKPTSIYFGNQTVVEDLDYVLYALLNYHHSKVSYSWKGFRWTTFNVFLYNQNVTQPRLSVTTLELRGLPHAYYVWTLQTSLSTVNLFQVIWHFTTVWWPLTYFSSKLYIFQSHSIHRTCKTSFMNQSDAVTFADLCQLCRDYLESKCEKFHNPGMLYNSVTVVSTAKHQKKKHIYLYIHNRIHV